MNDISIKDPNYGEMILNRLNSTPKEGLLRKIYSSLDKNHLFRGVKEKHLLFTPNSEIVNMMFSDAVLYKSLNKADILLIDGIGVVQARKFLSLPNPKNKIARFFTLIYQGMAVGISLYISKNWLISDNYPIPGREFFVDLIRLANKKEWKVFLLGDKSADDAKESLTGSFKKLQMYAFDGPWLDKNGDAINKDEKLKENVAIQKINEVKPDLLFVGFGAPKQEKWLAKHFDNLDVGLAMSVGRTFEWISGRSKQAPRIIANIGMEWLFRLFTGSTNLKRIFNAVIVFPLHIFFYKFSL